MMNVYVPTQYLYMYMLTCFYKRILYMYIHNRRSRTYPPTTETLQHDETCFLEITTFSTLNLSIPLT